MHCLEDGFRLMRLRDESIALIIYLYMSDLKIKILYYMV